MLKLSLTQLGDDVGMIQIMHARLGLALAKAMAYHTGNFMFIDKLNKKNMLVGDYIDILERYDILGDTTINDLNNVLTEEDIEAIIDDCYRELEKFNT